MLLHYADCTNKKSANAIKISELQQKIDTITSNVNAIMLQEKVIDKKISDVIKLQDNIKNELEEGKKQKDTLFSEIMDLDLGKHIYLFESKSISSTLYTLILKIYSLIFF